MRHVWSGLHDGCEVCMAFWPTRSITAREALERWPAPVRSRHAPTRLPQELAVLLPAPRSARGRKAVPTPSPKGSRQHRGKALDGQKLAHKKSTGSKTPKRRSAS